MAYWLLKSEPTVYSYEDLEKEKKAVWDGVTNNLALKYVRQVKKGDLVLIYHTGDEKAITGIAEVTSAAYPDPKQNDAKLVVFDIKPKKKVARRVTLSEIKADQKFKDFDLVRLSRLSVIPVSEVYWDLLTRMAEGK